MIRRAVELSEGRPVAVVTIARIYGSSLGLPNPGLLPTRKEMDEQLALVNKAIDRLERSRRRSLGPGGLHPALRQDHRPGGPGPRGGPRAGGHPEVARWRRLIEGDVARDVGAASAKGVAVEGITV